MREEEEGEEAFLLALITSENVCWRAVESECARWCCQEGEMYTHIDCGALRT